MSSEYKLNLLLHSLPRRSQMRGGGVNVHQGVVINDLHCAESSFMKYMHAPYVREQSSLLLLTTPSVGWRKTNDKYVRMKRAWSISALLK